MPTDYEMDEGADNMGAEEEGGSETIYISKDKLGSYDCKPGDILTFEVVSVDEDAGEVGMDFKSEESPDEDEEEKSDLAALRAAR